MGTFGVAKTVKKSMYWWRHGKHRFMAEINLILNRPKIRYKSEMYNTVQQAMAAAKRSKI